MKTKIPLFQGAYQSSVPQANIEALVNWFPEMNIPGERNTTTLLPTPGLTLYCTFPASGGGVGALHAPPYTSNIYAVVGIFFYEIVPQFAGPPVVNNLGTVGLSGSFIITDNGPLNSLGKGAQIIIVEPSTGGGWTFNTSTRVFAPLGASFQSGIDITFQDGYGIYPQENTNTFWVTNPYNFLTTPALNFASLQSTSGNLVATKSDNTRLYLLGTQGMEVWYDSGDPAFPFTRIPSAVYPKGCLAAKTVQKIDNSMVWFGTNEYGQAQVYQMRGENPPTILSTPQVEWQFRRWANPANSMAFVYQERGHEFYVLTYTGTDALTTGTQSTFVYDVSTQRWHTRSSAASLFTGANRNSWLPSAYCFLVNAPGFPATTQFGQHIIGSPTPDPVTGAGSLYVLDQTNATDAGTPIQRTCISTHINDKNGRIFLGSIEAVLGAPADPYSYNVTSLAQLSGQTLTMSWAKNNNLNPTAVTPQSIPYSWANSFTYTVNNKDWQRMKQFRLGWARDWVFQLTTTAPIAVLDAFVDVLYRDEENEQGEP
jgi:hypothetical protein